MRGYPQDKAMLAAFIKLLRPHQWPKNALIFGPLLFAQKLLDPTSLWRSALAFGCFCLLTSSIYILNDIIDVEQDRLHPKKSKRPIASGAFPETLAWRVWPLLALGSTGAAFFLAPPFALVCLVYLVINIAYCFKTKHIPYLDVLSIASGFVLRVLGGAFAIQVYISRWLLPCTFLLALYLAFGKRRHELANHEKRATRAVLQRYKLEHLDLILCITASLAILGYCGYTLDPSTIQKFKTYHLIYTVPFVVFSIVRFQQIMTFGAQMESPTQELLRDIPSLLNVLLWVAVVVYIIYFQTGRVTWSW